MRDDAAAFLNAEWLASGPTVTRDLARACSYVGARGIARQRLLGSVLRGFERFETTCLGPRTELSKMRMGCASQRNSR